MPVSDSHRFWTFPGFRQEFGKKPMIMGIVNATPDSFSDGGKYLASELAVDQAIRLISEGADIIDIGGESTRPGSDPVNLEEELKRVMPVIEALADLTTTPISIDTSKSEVARQALRSGAKIVNDVSGLRFDPRMIDVCLENPCGVICMHMQGTPKTMQTEPSYEDVVEEIVSFFTRRLAELEKAGLRREQIVIDPGIGFGKTAQHNIEILSSISRLHRLDRPVLIGHSRKRFLQKVIGHPLDEKSFGTVGVSIALAEQNVDILRVHDVAANHDAITAWRATRPRHPLSAT